MPSRRRARPEALRGYSHVSVRAVERSTAMNLVRGSERARHRDDEFLFQGSQKRQRNVKLRISNVAASMLAIDTNKQILIVDRDVACS